MYLVIDVETSGLPKKPTHKHAFKDLDAYSSARIVSIAWIVLDVHMREKCCEYVLVTPEDEFVVPKESTAIHGITNEDASAYGITRNELWNRLGYVMKKYNCTTLIAHNAHFDRNVILSELYRAKQKPLLNRFWSLDVFCTMNKARYIYRLTKSPKLSELYNQLFKRPMPEAHNALYDTMHCADCFKAMIRETIDGSLRDAQIQVGHIETACPSVAPPVVPVVAVFSGIPPVPPVTL
jgi:DNA polymerase III epsilon subunit-like protein